MGSILEGPKIDTGPTNRLINKGLGAGKDLKPVGLNAGGLSGTYKNGTVTVTPSAGRLSLVDQLKGQYGDLASQLANLRGQYAPGYSALRAAQLASIENARQSSVSNLRDNLARRRVLGSSFASDAETRTNLEYENQKNNVIADTYLKELDATNSLIQEEYTARVNQVTTGLNELNLEANLGTTLTQQANQVLSNSAQLQAQVAASGAGTLGQIATAQANLDAGAQSGLGNLLGYVGGKLLGPTLGGAGSALATALV
jgi:hypothetical protein